MEKLVNGLLWYIVFIFSITFHEAAHALISFRIPGTPYLIIDREAQGVASLFLIEVNAPLASDPKACYRDRKKLHILCGPI